MLTSEIKHQLSEGMQKGYDHMLSGNSVAACQEWHNVWEEILSQMDERQYEGIEQFDEVFDGQESIYNWASDYECELSNAALDDISFVQMRINFCKEYIAHVNDKNDYNALAMRGAIAESHFLMGQTEESEALYMQYLNETPTWGMGWVQWSRMYMLDSYLPSASTGTQDGEKAISILEQGLRVEDLVDRKEVLMVLRETYISLGLLAEAKKITINLQQLVKESKPKPTTRLVKIGRNDPCPCGSNKKYKKCCGMA